MKISVDTDDKHHRHIDRPSRLWPFVVAALATHALLIGSIAGIESLQLSVPEPDPIVEVQIISFAASDPQESVPSVNDQAPGVAEPIPEPVPEPPPPAPEPIPEPVPEPPPPAPEPIPEPVPEPPPPAPEPIPEPVPEPPPPAPKPTLKAGSGGKQADSVAAQASTAASYDAAFLKNPAPRYPISAYRERAQGTVIVRVEVLPDGRSGKVVLQKSSGFESLDKAAMDGVSKWRFKPATEKGKPVRQWVSIPIDFKLKVR